MPCNLSFSYRLEVSIDIHAFVKDANDGHTLGCDPKVDHVPFNAAAAITGPDVITRRRRFGGLRQHRKRSGEGIGVVVRLFGAPLVAAVGPDRLKVSFSRRSETMFSHA
jgi:hypothetical protein